MELNYSKWVLKVCWNYFQISLEIFHAMPKKVELAYILIYDYDTQKNALGGKCHLSK